MPFNPDIHHRRSVRLQGWDYSSPGMYYITICTHLRECLFGEVIDAEMRLNEFGNVADTCWQAIPGHTQRIELDEWAVMPNHVHLLFVLNERDAVGATRRVAPTTGGRTSNGPKPGSVGAVISQYKPRVTRQINHLRNTPGSPLWQRSFYDHIVRTQPDLDQIRQYIDENPMKWHLDHDNPDNW